MIRKLALWLAALTLAFPLGVLALGLGNVTVNSALNEPLNAEIGLMSLKAGEVEDIKVKLGTSDAFQRAGLDRPYILSKVRFRVREDAAGGAVIKVTTAQPLREPFLSFIVEVSWSTGRLLREYTLLLDPPIYGAAISAKVAGPVVVVGGEDFTTMKAPVGTGESTAVTAASTADISGSFTGDTYGPTVKSDTLWSIARRVRPNSSISIQRMMLALQQANPQAFINNNINALRAGEVLHIPDLEDIPDMSQAEALENVRDQHAQWEELRQGMAAVAGEAPAGLAGDATGEAPAVEAEEDRLEILSAGRGEVGLSDDQNTAILRKRLALNEEELNSKQAENEELGSRVMELEGLVTDLNRMIQFKNDELASLQQRLGEEGAEAETTDYVEMTEAEEVSVEEPEVEEEAEAGMAEVAEEEQPEEVAVAEEPAPKPVTPPLPRPKPLLPPPPAPEPISFL
ncbi:MAG: hypothetical protein GY731_06490, partial [Gammaproteobacteria bacterium]|nr:hypothetical protein [Gammaproteobacteria bacterium]